MTYKIDSFSDKNFLKLGLFCIAAGILLSVILFVANAPWWIGFRGGLGLGLCIILAHYTAIFFNKRRSK